MNRYSFLTKLVTDKFKLYTSYLKKGFPVGGDPMGTVLQDSTVIFPNPWEKVTPTNIFSQIWK